MRRSAPGILFCVLVSLVAACGSRDGRFVAAINGKVVSALSGAPLPDAQVLVEWEAYVDVFVERQRTIVRRCQTRAAADGTFSVRAWQAGTNVPSDSPVRARSYAFMPGYRMLDPDAPAEHAGEGLQKIFMIGGSATDGSVAGVADCAADPVLDTSR